MDILERRILEDGIVAEGDILKVDSFLNHQIDVSLMREIGAEFYRLFGGCGVNKILTIESSGIGVSCITAQFFNVPVVFAKKIKTVNIAGDVYSSRGYSYTHRKSYEIVVSRRFLDRSDKVLIIDDFLAKGSAVRVLVDICSQAGAGIAGAGIVIEKAYQGGGDELRGRGIRVESLASIEAMSVRDGISFRR